ASDAPFIQSVLASAPSKRRSHPRSTLFPYTTLFRSEKGIAETVVAAVSAAVLEVAGDTPASTAAGMTLIFPFPHRRAAPSASTRDPTSPRLNSSHLATSYAALRPTPPTPPPTPPPPP